MCRMCGGVPLSRSTSAWSWSCHSAVSSSSSSSSCSGARLGGPGDDLSRSHTSCSKLCSWTSKSWSCLCCCRVHWNNSSLQEEEEEEDDKEAKEEEDRLAGWRVSSTETGEGLGSGVALGFVLHAGVKLPCGSRSSSSGGCADQGRRRSSCLAGPPAEPEPTLCRMKRTSVADWPRRARSCRGRSSATRWRSAVRSLSTRW